jgi:hypothetical protein
VRATDEVTDKILDRLGNPRDMSNWSRRGMVVGHVQSGKTANYTGLVCKAADAGYRLIVGIHNNLRNQTQGRIDEGFIGRDTSRLASKDKDKRQKIIGVGNFDQRHFPVSLTNTIKDFNKATATTIAVSMGQLNVPVVLVIKKNANTLKHLVEWLREHSVSKGSQLVEEPMLLIDDEADNASINIKHGKEGVARINGQIRALLRMFRRSCYVGYRRAVHDLRDLGHIVVGGRLAHGAQLFLHADVDDEGAWWHQMARGDQLAQPDLVADIVEDLAQPLAIAPVRRGGDAEDPAGRVCAPDMVDDPAITVGHRVMRLVDDQQVERGHRGQVDGPRQSGHHGKGRLTGPALGLGIEHRAEDFGCDPAEFCPVLRGQLVAMREDAGLGVAPLEGLCDDRRKGDGLAEPRRGDAEGVAVIAERRKAALHGNPPRK